MPPQAAQSAPLLYTSMLACMQLQPWHACNLAYAAVFPMSRRSLLYRGV